jgi:hypothetical protein
VLFTWRLWLEKIDGSFVHLEALAEKEIGECTIEREPFLYWLDYVNLCHWFKCSELSITRSSKRYKGIVDFLN